MAALLHTAAVAVVAFCSGYMVRATMDGPELGWLDYAAWLSLLFIGWLVRDVIGIQVDQEAARGADAQHEQLREVEP